ncbi:MAG TPA: VOC family protein [Acidimicrobiales bacterium]
MAVTKAYFMLMVADMDRAVAFYRDAVGLALRFQSPEWTELSWGEAFIALHGGRPDSERAHTGLGFEVDDLDGFVGSLSAAGAAVVMPPSNRPGEPIRLATIADPDGNVFNLAQPS